MAKVILIVEDDPKTLRTIRDLLQVSGYSTVEATDGKQGVELSIIRKPDLILMDVMMPVMDGYAACHAIKLDEVTKEIPIIMLTSLGYELNEELSKNMGANAYITKPFEHQELLDIIGRLLPTP